MKLKLLATLTLVTIFTSLLSADETPVGTSTLRGSAIPLERLQEPWYTYRYVKLGAGSTTLDSDFGPGAAVGGGVRIVTGHSGVDLSVDYIDGERNEHTSHTLVGKGLYLYTFTPSCGHSLYAGAGMGFGRSKLGSKNFVGVLGEGVLGYALATHKRVLAFVELGVHHPVLPTGNRNNVHYKPSASLTFGVGF